MSYASRVRDQIVFELSRRDQSMAAPAPAGLSLPRVTRAPPGYRQIPNVEYCFSEGQLIKLARIPSRGSKFHARGGPYAAQEHGFSDGRSNTHSIHL